MAERFPQVLWSKPCVVTLMELLECVGTGAVSRPLDMLSAVLPSSLYQVLPILRSSDSYSQLNIRSTSLMTRLPAINYYKCYGSYALCGCAQESLTQRLRPTRCYTTTFAMLRSRPRAQCSSLSRSHHHQLQQIRRRLLFQWRPKLENKQLQQLRLQLQHPVRSQCMTTAPPLFTLWRSRLSILAIYYDYVSYSGRVIS